MLVVLYICCLLFNAVMRGVLTANIAPVLPLLPLIPAAVGVGDLSLGGVNTLLPDPGGPLPTVPGVKSGDT